VAVLVRSRPIREAGGHWRHGLGAEYQEQDQPGQIHSGILDPMSGSDQGKRTPLVELVLPAIGFLLAAAIVWGLGFSAGSSSSDNANNYRHQAYRYATDKPQEIDPALARPSGSQPIEYRTPCKSPKGKDESDLCAQWRAADAAEQSALWAKWCFWIALAGIIGLYWQVVLTRRAVEDTSTATEAMKEANRIAQDTAKRQLRAYLYVELKEVPKLIVGEIPEGHFWVKNGGLTPAHNFRLCSAFTIGKIPFEGQPPEIPEDAFSKGTYKAQGSSTVAYCKATTPITQAWVNAVTSGTHMIVMYGEIRYDDVFGEPHITRYRANFGGELCITNECVLWHDEGNEAT